MRSTPSLSVRATLVVAAILPVALFTLGTAAVLYSVARTQLERGMQERLDTIAALLVESTRSGVVEGSRELVHEGVLSALADRDVVHISVYDASGELLVSEGDPAIAPLRPAERRIDGPEEFRALTSRLDELRVSIAPPALASAPVGMLRIVISADRSLAQYRQLLLSSSVVLAGALAVGIGLAALLWRRLLRAIGREDLLDDPRMVDGPTRASNREAVDAAITQWTSQRTKQEVMRVIAGAGVPCGAVLNTLELLHDADLRARGMMQTIDHPVRGSVPVPGWPLRMSDSKVALKSAPELGADSAAVCGEWLGCQPDEIAEMRRQRVI